MFDFLRIDLIIKKFRINMVQLLIIKAGHTIISEVHTGSVGYLRHLQQ